MSAIEPPSLWPTRIGSVASSCTRSAGSTSSASSWKNAGVRGRGGGPERPWPKREKATARRPVAALSAAGKSRQRPTEPSPSCSSTSGRRAASPGHSTASTRRPSTVAGRGMAAVADIAAHTLVSAGPRRGEVMSSQVDYVVIGAGSAGCAVAARLSEDAGARVVVLEAGGPDTLEAIHQPPMWPALWGTEVDWAYETVPQAANGGLVHQWPRGKVLGGSSSLNGMVYVRGNPADFDDWAYHGCKGWDYDALLPLFRRMEDVPEGDPHWRGRGGPNTPRPAADPNPICAAFVEAAREKGHPVTDDHNGAQFEAPASTT